MYPGHSGAPYSPGSGSGVQGASVKVGVLIGPKGTCGFLWILEEDEDERLNPDRAARARESARDVGA